MSQRLEHITNWHEVACRAKWSPAEMARECGVSLRTLERRFVRRMGKTPQAWLTEERMARAHELLTEGFSVRRRLGNWATRARSILPGFSKSTTAIAPACMPHSAKRMSATGFTPATKPHERSREREFAEEGDTGRPDRASLVRRLTPAATRAESSPRPSRLGGLSASGPAPSTFSSHFLSSRLCCATTVQPGELSRKVTQCRVSSRLWASQYESGVVESAHLGMV